MSEKQLLIYSRAVAISSAAHRDVSVRTGKDYGFAVGINSVPIIAAEFAATAGETVIVFAGTDASVMPVALLGARDGQNAFVAPDGAWSGRYVPAFLRRYPFVFSTSDDGKTLTLCIDEDFAGVNREGRGERLFDSDGNRTRYLEQMLAFARDYQDGFARTRAFCDRLVQHDLLTPGQATFSLGDGVPAQLGGFFTIDRAKLRALPPETLAQMAATDELEMCYIHLQSLNNLDAVARRAGESGKAAPEETRAPATETVN